MTRVLKYTSSFLFFTFIAMLCAAQKGIRVKATIDKNRILIGEHIELKLEADIPAADVISFFSIDSLPHFDIIERQRIDTSDTNQGTLLRQTIRITSFDSGHFVIPRFMISDSIATDSLPVDVSYSSFDPNQPYHDIKDVIDVEVEKKTPWWWYATGGAGLLILAVLIYWLTRKKKVVVKPVAAPVDAYQDAMQQLEQLTKNKPAAKQYYSALADIFRQYVSRKKNINSLQETSDGLIVQLRALNMPKDSFDRLAQALQLADFVKFAKYIPDASDDQSTMNTIEQSIKQIEQLN